MFCLYACKGERKEQNTNSTIIEKKWAKDCSNDSKIHVLSSNAQFANGKKVLTNKQEYMQMTKDCIYNVETLVAKYLDDKDKNHYSNKNNTYAIKKICIFLYSRICMHIELQNMK